MLLTLPLPSVLGKDKFYAEFDRCRGYYLHGIPDELLEVATQRFPFLDEMQASIWPEPSTFRLPNVASPSGGQANASRPRSSSVNDVPDYVS